MEPSRHTYFMLPSLFPGSHFCKNSAFYLHELMGPHKSPRLDSCLYAHFTDKETEDQETNSDSFPSEWIQASRWAQCSQQAKPVAFLHVLAQMGTDAFLSSKLRFGLATCRARVLLRVHGSPRRGPSAGCRRQRNEVVRRAMENSSGVSEKPRMTPEEPLDHSCSPLVIVGRRLVPTYLKQDRSSGLGARGTGSQCQCESQLQPSLFLGQSPYEEPRVFLVSRVQAQDKASQREQLISHGPY